MRTNNHPILLRYYDPDPGGQEDQHERAQQEIRPVGDKEHPGFFFILTGYEQTNQEQEADGAAQQDAQ